MVVVDLSGEDTCQSLAMMTTRGARAEGHGWAFCTSVRAGMLAQPRLINTSSRKISQQDELPRKRLITRIQGSRLGAQDSPRYISSLSRNAETA